MTDIISLAIQLVIAIVSVLLGKYCIPFLSTKINANKIDTAKKISDYLVAFAEVLFTDRGMGEEKLDKVTQELTKQLRQYNINLTENEIRGLIEKSVQDMKSKQN